MSYLYPFDECDDEKAPEVVQGLDEGRVEIVVNA